MSRASHNSILAALQRTLQHPDVHAEAFFPIEHCQFDGGRLQLNQERKKQAASSICGIRLTAARIDERGGASSDTRACQADVGHLVQSLVRMRQQPELSTTVVSKQGLRCRASGKAYATRVRFGLECGSAGYRDERKAARVCHRRIVAQIRAAGFRVTEPASFDDRTGFEGLANWADHLRLERRRPWWLLALSILLLCLLPLIPSCESRATFAGLPVTTRGIVILLDKSGSMGSSFADVKRETQRLLTERKQEGFRTWANLIYYDAKVGSVLGELRQVDEPTERELFHALDGISPDGGTEKLQDAIALAAKEIAVFGKATTVIVLTDGEDSTLPNVVADLDAVREQFGDIPVTIHALSPRYLTTPPPSVGAASTGTLTTAEQNLKRLAEEFDGQFGPGVTTK